MTNLTGLLCDVPQPADALRALREEWLPLLQRLLACLRHARETPLQFEVDCEGIVAAALIDAPADPRCATPMMNQLVGDILDVRSDRAADASLATWLDRLYRDMRAVHPAAIDILALRVEGYVPRDIAERLGLGLRQVHHMTREMRARWQGAG